jgi:hypothetical protein
MYTGPNIVTDGLVLVLALDAANTKSYPGTGTTWNDLSGNGNNGTLVNGVGYNSGNGGSLVFDGVNDYISIPHTTILNPSLSMTLSSWINATTFLTFMSIFGKGTTASGSGGYDFRIDANNQLNLVKYFIVDQRITLSTALSINTWYNIVAVQSSTRVDYYINGSNVGAFSNSIAYQTNTSEFRIARDRNIIYTPAKVSNLSFYNRALTPQEVQQNFNALRHRFGI